MTNDTNHTDEPIERRAQDDEAQLLAMAEAEAAGRLPENDRRISPAAVEEATAIHAELAPHIEQMPEPIPSRWARFLDLMGGF